MRATALRRGGERLLVSGSGGWSSNNWVDILRQNTTGRKRSSPDWANEAGNVGLNSAVAACQNWLITSWVQAPAIVAMIDPETREPKAKEHPATILLEQPSPFYGGRWLFGAWLTDMFTTGRGRAYGYIVTTDGDNGEPVEIQYLPAGRMKPVTEGTELIAYYEYTPPRGEVERLPREQVLDFRYGLDPSDPTQTIWPLRSVLGEIATDNQAVAWQWNLMTRGAVPPYVISPKGVDGSGTMAVITRDDAAFIKAQAMDAEPGTPLVAPVGIELQKLAFAPKEMATAELQRKAEERIAAQYGLPPVVVGLGAGLDRSTFNNYEEARQAAWEDCVIPLQDLFASELSAKLLPLFEGNAVPSGMCITFDRSQIRALADDKTAEAGIAKITAETAQILINAGFTKESVVKGLSLPSELVVAPEPKPEPMGAGQVPQAQGKKPAVAPSERSALIAVRKSITDNTSKLYQVADAFRRDLERREDQAVASMERSLSTVENDLNERIAQVITRIRLMQEAGEIVTDVWLKQLDRYRSLLSGVQEAFSKIGREQADPIREAQLQNAANAVFYSNQMSLPAVGGDRPESVDVKWNALPREQLETLTGLMSDGSPITEHFNRMGAEVAEAMRDVLIAGVGRGAGAEEMARELAGVMGSTTARCRAIARTEPLRAAREASRQSYLANTDVVTGYIRLSATDSRVCPACWAKHGERLPLSRIMPTHVQCRCVMVPETRSWAEITGDESIPDTRPMIESGETVFSRLPESAQREILGPGRYTAYRAGSPLASFAEESNDDHWGPTLKTKTIEDFNA